MQVVGDLLRLGQCCRRVSTELYARIMTEGFILSAVVAFSHPAGPHRNWKSTIT